MKKVIAIIIASLFVFAMTSLSFAVEEKKAAPAVEKNAPTKIRQITGLVKTVDEKAMTITVSKKMREKVIETTILVDDKTKIMMDKEKKTFADVKVGDKVIVKFTEAEGKNSAKSIKIKIAEKKTASAKSAG